MVVVFRNTRGNPRYFNAEMKASDRIIAFKATQKQLVLYLRKIYKDISKNKQTLTELKFF